MSSIEITVWGNYFVIPVSDYVSQHNLSFWVDGVLADDISVRIDYRNPTAYSYYPIGSYKGGKITVTASPSLDLQDRQSDTIDHFDGLGCKGSGEVYRPYIHFTTEYGWINDPNGLLKYTSPVTGETVYHMFYQHNPYDWVWGNMHWGHAFSRDLINWEHLPIALYPDEMGTMFSGSAIVDKENRSGLKTGDEDVILLFYTAAGGCSRLSAGAKSTQCLAYSNDGGMTFTKYEHNPIVPHIIGGNRDPKVIWCEEIGKYIMALYLDGRTFALLASDDFIHWEELQRLDIENDAECPDIFPLPVNGDVPDRKWVMIAASSCYVVGEFTDGKFDIIQEPRRLYSGNGSYAAQTVSTDEEYERIQIAWDNTAVFGNAAFRCQMSVPCTLSLEKDDGGYHLVTKPIPALDAAAREIQEYCDVEISSDKRFSAVLDECAYELDLELDHDRFVSDIRMDLLGQVIGITADGKVNIGNNSVSFTMREDGAKIRIIIDKGTAEVFTDGGRGVMTTAWLANLNRMYLEISLGNPASQPDIIGKITLKKLVP